MACIKPSFKHPGGKSLHFYTYVAGVVTQINTLEGRVVLAAVLPFVEGVFRATQLDRFFEICGTVDDAVTLLANHSDAALT